MASRRKVRTPEEIVTAIRSIIGRRSRAGDSDEATERDLARYDEICEVALGPCTMDLRPPFKK